MIYFVDKSAAEEHVQFWHHRVGDLLVAHTECTALVFKVGYLCLKFSLTKTEVNQHIADWLTQAVLLSYKTQTGTVLDFKHFSGSLFKGPNLGSSWAQSNQGWKQEHLPQERQGLNVVLFCSRKKHGSMSLPRRSGLVWAHHRAIRKMCWPLKPWAIFFWKGQASTIK